MAAPFDLNDDGVVVVIGTGAGGGVLANELAPEGRRASWRSRRAGATCPRTTSTTSGRASASSPGPSRARPRATGGWPRTSPACRPGSSRRSAAPRSTGRAPRCASRTTSGRRTRPMAGRRAPTCSTGRSTGPRWRPGTTRPRPSSGVTRTGGRPGLPGNNNYKVLEAGAKAIGYKEVHTGRMAINSSRLRRPDVLPADRLLLPGLQVGRQMVDGLYRHSARRGHRQPGGARPLPRDRGSSTTADGQGHRRRLFRQGRQGAAPEGARSSASPATRSRARGCC